MKTLHVHSNGQWQEVVGSPGALDGYYTIVQTDAAIKASRDEGALDLDAVQNQVLFAVTETARQLQERIDLKDGDLWLAPATTSVAAKQLATLSLSDPACAAFRQSVMDEVRKMISGGKTVPADIDWTPCTKVAGSGLIEARVLNGMIQLRGELTLTVTATGTFTVAQRLPANFPKPPREQTVVAFGYDTGVSYRRVFVRFYPDGGVGVVGDGKITGTELTGATAYAY